MVHNVEHTSLSWSITWSILASQVPRCVLASQVPRCVLASPAARCVLASPAARLVLLSPLVPQGVYYSLPVGTSGCATLPWLSPGCATLPWLSPGWVILLSPLVIPGLVFPSCTVSSLGGEQWRIAQKPATESAFAQGTSPSATPASLLVLSLSVINTVNTLLTLGYSRVTLITVTFLIFRDVRMILEREC